MFDTHLPFYGFDMYSHENSESRAVQKCMRECTLTEHVCGLLPVVPLHGSQRILTYMYGHCNEIFRIRTENDCKSPIGFLHVWMGFCVLWVWNLKIQLICFSAWLTANNLFWRRVSVKYFLNLSRNICLLPNNVSESIWKSGKNLLKQLIIHVHYSESVKTNSTRNFN